MNEKYERVWNRTFTSIFIANMMMNLGLQMINTMVSKYAKYLGASAQIIGIVASLYSLTALIFKVFSAPAIDTFNRKHVAIFSISLMSFAFYGYSLSHSISQVIVFRLLQGTAQAFSATCCLALASDSLPANKLSSGLGIFALAQSVSQAIGPTIGLYLIQFTNYNITFAVGATLTLCGALSATQIHNEHKTGKKFRISFNNIFAPEAIIPCMTVFFLAMTYSNINSFLVIFAESRGVTANIGFFFTIYAVTLLFTRPLVGVLTDRYGLVKVAIPALLFFAAAFLLLSFADSLWMFLLVAVISAFGYGACHPALQSLCMKCVPRERRGAASSTNYIGTDLGNLVGPIVAGYVADRLGYTAMWRFLLIPICIAIAVIIFSRHHITAVEARFTSR
jgi:MFS family permease